MKRLTSDELRELYLDFFKKKGFVVEVLEEFTTSKKYKQEIYPTLNNKKGTLYLDSGNHFELFK